MSVRTTTVVEPLAITGLGCICSLGADVRDVERGLWSGERPVPRPPMGFTTDHRERYPVHEVSDAWLGEADSKAGRCARLARRAAGEALAQAGLGASALRVGLSIGTVAADPLTGDDACDGQMPALESLLTFIEASPARSVQQALGLRGPHQMVTTACSSGSLAIAQAAGWVRGGVCEAAIAGGAERITRLCYNGFASLMIADPNPCRPFDRGRSGLNLGEGAGFIVLERAAMAQARGARVLGWLLGDGNGCDAHNLAQPDPQGDGLRRAIAESLRLSEIGASDVGFINAHGTGTQDNDQVEARVFGAMLEGVPFLSTKGLTGHTLGAAGGIEAVLTVLCLQAGQIPASAGFAEACPDCGCSPVAGVRAIQKRYAMSTSVGYGGSNAALVFAAAEGGAR